MNDYLLQKNNCDILSIKDDDLHVEDTNWCRSFAENYLKAKQGIDYKMVNGRLVEVGTVDYLF